MWIDDTAMSATSSIAMTASMPTFPVIAKAMPSVAAHATKNTAMLKITAPLRDDLRGTYVVATSASDCLSVKIYGISDLRFLSNCMISPC